MTNIPKPIGHDTFDVEPFSAYRARLSPAFSQVPDSIIESWIYRHWHDFQDWLVLEPLQWKYSLVSLSSDEVLKISHVGDWPDTLKYWGDDLIYGNFRKSTWLGSYMLAHGTTPTPMVIAIGAGEIAHPRERGVFMREPYQIIEGHMRLAYLQALIRRQHRVVKASHEVYLVKLPHKNRGSGLPSEPPLITNHRLK